MEKCKNISKQVGREIVNMYGSRIKVIKTLPNRKLLVEFVDTKYTKEVFETNFYKKEVKSPYCRSVEGVGFIGEGFFASHFNMKKSKEYKAWLSMLRRCYSLKAINNDKCYSDVTVCEEWHNFQNFAKWYSENYYEIVGEKTCLDKDILVKNNKEYSPKTCCIVPETINSFFVKNNKTKSKYLPGVGKNREKYYSRININGITHIKHGFLTEEEAFYSYKEQKESFAKELANMYYNVLSKKIYDILVNYSVEDNLIEYLYKNKQKEVRKCSKRS